MSLSSITDVAEVRTLAGLSSDESTGAATAGQIEAAILLGQQKLKKAVGSDVYKTVRDFSSDDLDVAANQDKQDAFSIGEAYFAIAALPLIAKNQQIGQSGMPMQAAVGQGTISFATMQETDDAAKPWLALAYEAIADYLVGTLSDDQLNDISCMDDPDDTGVESEDGEFSFLSI